MKSFSRISRIAPLVQWRLVIAGIMIGTCTLAAAGESPQAPAEPLSYDKLIAEGNGLMKEGKLREAFSAAAEAAKLDSKRFEAYALTALILYEKQEFNDAAAFLGKALERAPEEKKAKLGEIGKMIAAAKSAKPATPANPPKPAPLSKEARRKLDTLVLITEEADRAKTASERETLLKEFIEKSETFLAENPDEINVWSLRAAVAAELDERHLAWKAGREIVRLGGADSDDPKIRKVLAVLDRKGWFGEHEPGDEPLSPKDFVGKWDFLPDGPKTMPSRILRSYYVEFGLTEEGQIRLIKRYMKMTTTGGDSDAEMEFEAPGKSTLRHLNPKFRSTDNKGTPITVDSVNYLTHQSGLTYVTLRITTHYNTPSTTSTYYALDPTRKKLVELGVDDVKVSTELLNERLRKGMYGVKVAQ